MREVTERAEKIPGAPGGSDERGPISLGTVFRRTGASKASGGDIVPLEGSQCFYFPFFSLFSHD